MYGFLVNRFFFVNIFFILLILSACRKKEDTTPPLIFLDAPSANSSFQLPHSISVFARIEDNHKIESVQVQLLNSNNIPVASAPVEANGSTFQEVSVSIDVQDLPTGSYFVRVKASDGNTHTSKYVSIQLQTVPRQLQKTVVAIGSSSNLSLHELSQGSSSFSLWRQLNLPFIAMDRLPDSKSLVVMSDHPYGTKFLDPMLGTDQFTVPSVQQIGGPSFTMLSRDPEEDLIWIASHTGMLQAFNSLGQTVHSFSLHNSNRAICMERFNDLLIIGEQQPTGSTYHLSVYYLSSGTLKSTRQLTLIPSFLKRISASDVNVYAYQANETHSADYNFQSDILSSFSTFHPARMKGFISDQSYLYCYDNSGVWKINPITNTSSSFYVSPSCMDLELEELSGNVWIADPLQLNLFSSTGSLLTSFSFSDTIRAVTCVYNK